MVVRIPCPRRCLKGGFLRALTRAYASDTSWAFALLLPRSCLPRNKGVMVLVSNGLVNGLAISRIYLIFLQLFEKDCLDGPVMKQPLLVFLSLRSLLTLFPDFMSPFSFGSKQHLAHFFCLPKWICIHFENQSALSVGFSLMQREAK